jgi:serine/threonine-protein kinase
MGEVYRARHAERDQVAAVKLLAAHRQTQPNELRRFLREAEVVSQLRSPHVVEVYDAHDGAEGLPYIAMELLVGHDLSWHLRKQRTLSPSATVELVSHVAAALEHARERTIVHRDLKPQNLFHARVGGDLRLWKVLDFGISSLGGVAGSLTGGRPIGTPGYMAPEQARGGHLDHRADVFALTVIAYRALTGRPAFTGEDFPRVLFNVAYAQPLRPGELVSLPEDVDLVLAIGLAKDAADRFESALALADALLAATRGELTGRLRARAAALLARAPWGQPIR